MPAPCPSPTLLIMFFFQAEDGIRDTSVTGVQTCALPIYALFEIALHEIDRAETNERKHCKVYECEPQDRKSTRLNSSHRCISYAVFCLKKKKQNHIYKKF